MNAARRLVKNTLALSGADLFSKALNFAFIAILARQLTPSDFGGYITITSLLALFGALADLGVSQIMVREVAADRSQAGRLLLNGLVATGSTSLLAGGLLVAIAMLGNYPGPLRPLIVLAALAVFGNTLTLTASGLLRGLERMEIPALLNSGILLATSAGGILLALTGAGIGAQILVSVVGSLLGAGLVLLVTGRGFAPMRLTDFHLPLCRSLLRQALPVEVLIAYGVLLRWSDTLILGVMRPMGDVAVYATSQKVIDLVTIFNTSAAAALFPMLSNRWRQSAEATRELYSRSLRFFAAFGVAITGLLVMLAEPISVLLFGETYRSAGWPLQWLAIAFFFQVVSGPTGTLLIATGDHLKKIVLPTGLVVAGNIVSNWLLTPRWGYMGAAGVFVLTSAATFAIRQWAMSSYFEHPPRLMQLIWRPLLAGCLMVGALFLLRQTHLFLAFSGGAFVFVTGLWLTGELREAPYNQLWHLIERV